MEPDRELITALRKLDEGLYNLDHLIEYIRCQHLDCDPSCACREQDQFLLMIKNFITNTPDLMLMAPNHLHSTRHNLDWDELTIRDPEAEEAIDVTRRSRIFDNRITSLETKRFCKYLTDIFLRELENPENFITPPPNQQRWGVENEHRDPVERCDCVRWLEKTHPRIRYDALSRIYKFVKNHNTLATAIMAFTCQNEFNQRHELEEMRLRLNPPGNFWEKVRRLVTKGFMRDRARWLRHNRFELMGTIQEKYDAIIEDVRRNFPLFFLQNGKFDLTVFDRADPGDLFGCVKCRHEFPIGKAIVCQPTYRLNFAINIKIPERRQIDKEHKLCRACLRKIVDELRSVPAPDNGRIYVKCFDKTCSNPIVIDAETKRFLPRRIRHRLREMIVERLLIKNGLVPKPKRVKKPEYDDDDWSA